MFILLLLLAFVQSATSQATYYCHEDSETAQDNHWIVFNRPNATNNNSSVFWCIGVFGGVMSQADAAKQCKNMDATLSTLQTPLEINVIRTITSRVLTNDTGSLWVGMNRTPACINSTQTATCTTNTSFALVDVNTNPDRAFNFWDTDQPNNVNLTENCAVLLYAPQGTNEVVEQGTWTVGKLDDTRCDNLQSDGQNFVQRAQIGYICGKYAKKRGL